MEESLINAISILIACCALGLTIYQIHSIRMHNYLSVKPYIKFGWTAGDSGDGIWIKNVGLGTAVIEKFTIYFQGKKVNSKYVAEFLKKEGFPSKMTVATVGATIMEKDTHWLIQCSNTINDGEEQEKYWNLLEGTRFTIEYRCFYNRTQPEISWVCPNPIKEFVSQKPMLKSK